jgi:hypothetical protein
MNNAAIGVKSKGDMRQALTGSVSRALFNTKVLLTAKASNKVPGKLSTLEGKRLLELIQASGWSPERIGIQLL